MSEEFEIEAETKEDAIDAFKALRKGRPFIPKEFLNIFQLII